MNRLDRLTRLDGIQVAIFDPKNPTAPHSYVHRGFVQGMPLYWGDDVSGVMLAAVRAYHDQQPTPEQLRMVIAYIQHHIHAPCWLESSPFNVNEEAEATIRALRERSLTLASVVDVNEYIHEAIGIGLDPL